MARTRPHHRELKKLHLFVCEDSKSARFYINGLSKLSNEIVVKTISSNGNTPNEVYLTAFNEEKKIDLPKKWYQVYCMFDTDNCAKHELDQAIQKMNKKKFIPVVSNPCYEYWLLLHFENTKREFNTSDECCEAFRRSYNRKLNKDLSVRELKAKTDIFQDLKECLPQAVSNAKSHTFEEYENPYTNIHKIIEEHLKIIP